MDRLEWRVRGLETEAWRAVFIVRVVLLSTFFSETRVGQCCLADLSVKCLRVAGFGLIELKVHELSMLESDSSKRSPNKNTYLNPFHGFGV